MSEFTLHTLDTAPQASRKLLQNAEQQMGFIPNLFSVVAESPVALETYITLNKLFDKTAFSVTEQQLVLLSISRFRNCTYCLAAHGSIAKKKRVSAEIIYATYYNLPLQDTKLEALRTFTRAVLQAEGDVNQAQLQAFYQAGYQQQHVLDVILGISFKTLSNYINHINDTPIDPEFIAGIPNNDQVFTA